MDYIDHRWPSNEELPLGLVVQWLLGNAAYCLLPKCRPIVGFVVVCVLGNVV